MSEFDKSGVTKKYLLFFDFYNVFCGFIWVNMISYKCKSFIFCILNRRYSTKRTLTQKNTQDIFKMKGGGDLFPLHVNIMNLIFRANEFSDGRGRVKKRLPPEK